MDPNTIISPIAGALAATAVTSYLVGFFKKGFPSAESKWIVLIAILAGQGAAILETMTTGSLVASQIVIATVIGKGIVAAAMAAGINATNESGDAARIKAGTKEESSAKNP